MPKIVMLGELLPADFVVELPGGAQFTLPGDPPLELILKIAELFERTENAGANGGDAVGLEMLRELDQEMLRLLQMRDPELEHSPFGVMGVQHVVATLLQAYEFAAVEEPVPDDAEADPPMGDQSKQSNGSPSSSTSSDSLPTIGSASAGPSSKPGSGSHSVGA